MSKRPSFQFYPGDWKSNANLRRCSPAARGVWMDILGVLHDSDEYGVARWPLKELARAAGAAMAHTKELVEKLVLKGSDTSTEAFIYTPRSGRRDGDPVTLIPAQTGPLWYSSRMVKDEYVRSIRGEGGKDTRFGAENVSPDTAPKPPLSDGLSSSSPSSSSTSQKEPQTRPVSQTNQETRNPVFNGKRDGKKYGDGTTTIADPLDRVARFKAKLASHLGPRGWDIVMSATEKGDPDHDRCLALCRQAVRDLKKGWPRLWFDVTPAALEVMPKGARAAHVSVTPVKAPEYSLSEIVQRRLEGVS